tara:strand:+ start:9895 stop:10776 length:882 start_codon:yes stop_codon:yes gene_type:complete
MNWDDLKSFLILSRSSKLLIAAKKLKVEPTTIARRIKRLEKNLKIQLFNKSPKGYSLTERGLDLVKYSEKIENQIFGINERLVKTNSLISGKVRVTVGEGLGVEVISKNIEKFYQKYPEIEIELLADTKSRSISNKETDILICLSRPKSGRLICSKLCNYFVRLYASKEFLKKNKILNINDLNEKPFVSYVDEFIEFPELDYLKEVCRRPKIIFSSNSLRSQLMAVETGLGLGLLHTFIANNNPNLRVVLKNFIKIKREYWIVVDENNYQLERIKVFCNFLREIVKKRIYNFN